jgi:hypothetical protein
MKEHAMRTSQTAIILAALTAGALAAASAAASDIRSVVADGYGNAVIRTAGGAKIIAVGQAGLAEGFKAEAAEATANCREVGIVLRGRSYMYGVSDGDPVPLATTLVCD